MSCLLTEVQLRPRRRLSPDCYCTVVNYKTGFIFCRGGGGGGGGGGVFGGGGGGGGGGGISGKS